MEPIKTFACYLKEEKVRMCSSSGAVFSALASYVFSVNGVVYGVAMSEDCYSAEFISVTNEEGLRRVRGSKYLQAKAGDAYVRVKADLTAGKMVLFSGTGCQVNGLKKFLGRDYDHLVCVDVICHGVPSPALWKKYAQYQESKYGKLKTVSFRCKDKGWADFGMKENKVYISKDEDSYMQMFLRDYCLRPSCYECNAKHMKMSDMTIGDFWGIEKIVPEIDDNRGISLVIVRTDKGREIFSHIKHGMKVKEVSYGDGVKFNPAEFRSPGRPPERDGFFGDMNTLGFEGLERKYAAERSLSFLRRVKKKVKSIFKYTKKCTGGG